jgi:puromycin-sensitive aminopeptidase
MNPHRLPRTVVPSRYDIRLEPDLTTSTFTGHETVRVTVVEPVTDIRLNAVELTITSVLIENARGESQRGTAQAEPADERYRLSFPAPVAPGEWRLRLEFTGTLNDKLRGFYRSTYKDPSGVPRVLAATQFEATDARRAFPCWDEPDFKAVFASTLVIDPALTAVSNTAIVSERAEHGKKVVTFADTIKMSTYLVAYIVGELEATDAATVGTTPLRVWCVPGKKRLAGFGREIGAASLQFFEDYYGIPYPGDKLDLLAIPDFAAGAMENLGAITFRETALLVDEAQATHAEQERVADVVAHENAHMWFGDLVTMRWWEGIWLNEAFATFMEMLAVDAWKPQWRRWTSFGVSRASAFVVDGLQSTRPIEFPVGAPREADAMFDILTYEKGASVLRMLEQYLGPEVFRDGVRNYLQTHRFDNADTGDLWAALGRASREPIPAVMDAWIFTQGYPLVSLRREGDELIVSQQRFTYIPSTSDQRWKIPLQLRIEAGGAKETRRLLLEDAEQRIKLPGGFTAALANAGGHGFYRVRYASDLRDALLARLDTLEPIERFNLVNDMWAAATAGLVPVTDYLDLTARFRGEYDRNVWSTMLGAFASLNRIITPAERPGLEALVRDRLTPAVTELRWAPRAGEDELTRQLRGDLIRALGILGNDPGVQAMAAELYAEHETKRTEVDANVLPALIAIQAYTGNESRYREFLERFRRAGTPQEEQRYLYALAGFRQPALVDETLTRTINGEIRTQDAPFVNRSLLMTVHARERAWAFVKREWDTMDRLYPKHGTRRMAEGVTGLVAPALERDVNEFFASRKIDLGGKTLSQYLEQLRIAVALGEREGAALFRRGLIQQLRDGPGEAVGDQRVAAPREMHPVERERAIAQVDGASEVKIRDARLARIPRPQHRGEVPLLRDVRVRHVRLRHHEHARAARQRFVDPRPHPFAVVTERLRADVAGRDRQLARHGVTRQRPEHVLERARHFRGRLEGGGGCAIAAIRTKDRVLAAVALAEIAAVADRTRLLREHERQERQIARQPEHRRVMTEHADVRPPQVVVALVEQREVVAEIRVVGERLTEGPGPILDVAEIDDGDRRRSPRAQALLELRGDAVRRRDTVAERGAAADHDDAPFVRALRADDRAAVAPAIEPDAVRVVAAQQHVGRAEQRDGDREREDHRRGRERDALAA